MVSNEIVHVAVAPPARLEENLIKQVAAIVNKNLYETRLLLSGKIPKIIAHHNSMQIAESTATSLRVLGLVAIVCKDSELRKPSQMYRANTMKFEERAVLFRDRGGQSRRMESRDVFLIITGRMQNYTEVELTKTSKKLNLTATILTGGIPIRRTVKEKISDMSLQTDYFMRLYNQTSPEPSVEILQHGFDYSCLGAQMAASSVANFGAIVTRIKYMFTEAIFDDRLTEPFRVHAPSTIPQQSTDIDCKLIYLYYRAVTCSWLVSIAYQKAQRSWRTGWHRSPRPHHRLRQGLPEMKVKHLV